MDLLMSNKVPHCSKKTTLPSGGQKIEFETKPPDFKNKMIPSDVIISIQKEQNQNGTAVITKKR